MTQNELKKHFLDYDKTFPYFINNINSGKTLSNKIGESINFHQGVFYTFLPFNAQLDRLYEFSYGGIVPSTSDKNRLSCAEEHSTHPQQTISIGNKVSEYISDWIRSTNKGYSVIENTLLTPEDPYVHINNVDMVSYENEAYYFLNNKNSIEEINKTIRKSGQVWHFLAVLTVIKTSIHSPLKNEDLDKVCENLQVVIAGAYDEEGYIFWEKTNSKHGD